MNGRSGSDAFTASDVKCYSHVVKFVTQFLRWGMDRRLDAHGRSHRGNWGLLVYSEANAVDTHADGWR